MAKPDDRPFDSGLASVKAKSDAEVLEWMKQRLVLVAAVPTDMARVGAMLPTIREISLMPEAERRRLTKLRVQAFQALSSDQQQKILVARKLGVASDPDLLASDMKVIEGLRGEVPGVDDIIQRIGT